MSDLASTLAVRTALSHERAEMLARSWALLAAERGWSEVYTEHVALACAMAGIDPYDLRRALRPVRTEWSVEMTDLPTVPPTRCAVPPPPPPPPQGWRETELRQDALHLAVQSIEATSVIGGWVDEARTAVLCTADAYLAWLSGGEGRGDDTAKRERDRIELRDRRSEDLALRGLLSPNGGRRQVPMELGASLVPAVEWLLQQRRELLDALEATAGAELIRLRSWLHAHQLHPDYEYQTTRGPRKQWDDAGLPPSPLGWESNTDRAGGWERFDYHEESYWRRLRPANGGGDVQGVVCQACAGSGFELMNDRPTGNPCPACTSEAADDR